MKFANTKEAEEFVKSEALIEPLDPIWKKQWALIVVIIVTLNLLCFIIRGDFLGIRLLCWQLPFFLIGVLAAEFARDKCMLGKALQVLLVLLFPVAVYICLSHLEMHNAPGSQRHMPTVFAQGKAILLKYCIGFWGVAAVGVCTRFNKLKFLFSSNVLAFLGVYSLDVYVIHQMLIVRFSNSILAIILSTFIALFSSLFISIYLIRRVFFLRFLLLGKS